MFGIYRLILAMTVVVFHLWPQVGFFAGPMAVFGFYVLSGYLITKVIDETYSDGFGGFVRFVANRALRIYPTYYVALAVALLVLVRFPGAAAARYPFYVMPGTLSDWAAQLSVLGIHNAEVWLVPPAFSLAIELIFYGLIALGLGRSRALAAVWFAVSLVAVIVLLILGTSWEDLYLSLPGVSICFAVGSLLHHFDGETRLSGRHAIPAVIAFVAGTIIVSGAFAIPERFDIYIAAGLALYATAALKDLSPGDFGPRFRRIDALCGDLSYPVFLLHCQIAVAVGELLGFGWGFRLFAVSLLPTLLLSGLILRYVEAPLRPLRSTLRRPIPGLVRGAA